MQSSSDAVRMRKLSAFGLIKKAGAVVSGSELAEKSVKSGKSVMVIVSRDASARTVKRMSDACAYYKTEFRVSEFDMNELASAIGSVSPTAVLSITNKKLLQLVEPENQSGNNGGISWQKKE